MLTDSRLITKSSVWRFSFVIAFSLSCSISSLNAQTETKSQSESQEQVESKVQSKPEKWFGLLDVGAAKLRTLIEVTDKDGKSSAMMYSLDQTAEGFPADSYEVNGSEVTWKIAKLLASFKGTLDDKKETVEGTFSQAGREFKLTLKKVDKVPTQKLLERWTGELDVTIAKLKIQFRKLENEDKTQEVVFDSLTEGAKGIAAEMKIDGNDVTITIPLIKGSFMGKLSDDKDKIEGKWTQLTTVVPLVLTKSDITEKEEEIKVKRPQTPQEPFPYLVEDVSFENKSADIVLSGTLTIPKVGKDFPIAIMVSGSGPQDRDETLMGHKPFHVIADHLSRNGIAVLRYDERGVAKSTGDFSTATSKDFANDVAAAFDYLVKRPEFDPAKIGIIGHSEGGLIGPMVAAENEKVGFVVMLAGPGVNGEKIIFDQTRAMASVAGADEKTLDDQDELIRIALEASKKSDSAEQFQIELEKSLALRLSKFPEDQREANKIDEAAKANLQSFATPWFRYFLTYEPSSSLPKVKCPLLVLNGEKDLQVTHELNITAIKEALAESKKDNVTYKVFPDLNHLFQKCQTGLPNEYSLIEETFNQQALDTISRWIQNEVK